MHIQENSTVANWAITQVQKRMAERHGERTGALHASEIFQCFRKTYYQRTIGVPPLDFETIMRFAVGQSLQEFFLGPEKEGVEAYGIILSVDRLVSGQVLEFKSTRMAYEGAPKDATGKTIRGGTKVRFDPETNPYTQEWLTRCRAYCAAHGVNKAHIIVFFIFQTVLSAWTVEFTDEELDEARQDIEERRDILTDYLDTNTVPPVTHRTSAFECKNCVFLLGCMPDLREAGLGVEDVG